MEPTATPQHTTPMPQLATERQIKYARALLARAVFSTTAMDVSFQELGASKQECLGTVDAWLQSMTRPQISTLIADLLERIGA